MLGNQTNSGFVSKRKTLSKPITSNENNEPEVLAHFHPLYGNSKALHDLLENCSRWILLELRISKKIENSNNHRVFY